jgi:hypothetical protein
MCDPPVWVLSGDQATTQSACKTPLFEPFHHV